MKTYIALTLSLLLVSLSAFGVIATTVNAPIEEVTITENVRYGDISTAHGITVTTRAQYDRHLYWDTRYTVGGESETDFTFYTHEHNEKSNVKLSGITIDIQYDYSLDTYSNVDDLSGFTRVIRELYDEAAPGEEVTRKVYLRDFYEYYPVTMRITLPGVDMNRYSSTDKAFRAAFEEFLKIPVLEDDGREISVSRGKASNNTTGIGMGHFGSNYYFNTDSTYTSTTCYFTISNKTSVYEDNFRSDEVYVDTSMIPGGYGIYAFEYGKEFSEGIDTASLCTVYPLDKGATVLDITVSDDEKTMYLITNEYGGVVFTAIDIATMTDISKIRLDDSSFYSLTAEDGFVVLYTESGFAVIARTADGRFEYRFTASQTSDIDDSFYRISQRCVFDFDGERLAVVDRFGFFDYSYYDYSDKCHFFLAVYDASGLLCYAEYKNGLNVNPSNVYNMENTVYDSLDVKFGE